LVAYANPRSRPSAQSHGLVLCCARQNPSHPAACQQSTGRAALLCTGAASDADRIAFGPVGRQITSTAQPYPGGHRNH